MISVSNLIEQLKQYPADARAYAYEGEIVGIVIVDADSKQLGYIIASETDEDEEPFEDL